MRLLNIFFVVVLTGFLLMPTVNAGWWDPAYPLREETIIYNGNLTNDILNSTFELPVNYSGKTVLSDLNDSRLVWERHSDGTTYEADRINTTVIDTNGITNITLGTYTITPDDFNLSAGGYSNDSTQSIYRLWHYYNNPSAGTPPENRSHIYSFAEDVEALTLGDLGTQGGWTEPIAATFDVVDNLAFEGNKSIKITNDEGQHKHSLLQKKTGKLKVHLMLTGIAGRVAYRPMEGATVLSHIGFGDTGNRNIQVYDGSWQDTGHDYTDNVWYNFTIHFYSDSTFDFYVNETYINTYNFVASMTNGVDGLAVQCNGPCATQYFDLITYKSYLSPEPTYQFGAEELNADITITSPPDNSETSNTTINIAIWSNSSTGWDGDFNVSIDGTVTDTIPAINGTQTYSNSSLSEGSHTITVSGRTGDAADLEDTITLIVNRTNLIVISPSPGVNLSSSDVNFTWTCNGSSNTPISSWVNLNGSITYNSSPVTLGVPYTEIITVPDTGTYTYNVTCEFYSESWGSYNETSENVTFNRVIFLVNLSIIDEETGLYLNKTLNISIKNANYTTISSSGCLHSCVLSIPSGTTGIQIYFIETSWPGDSPVWTRQVFVEVDYTIFSEYNISLYMPDNDTTSTIYSNIWLLDDPTMEYNHGLLEVKRYINNSLILIHFGFFDIEGKIRTDLIGGDNYILTVYTADRSSSRGVGWWVPEDSNDKTLSIDAIPLFPDVSLAYNDVKWRAYASGGSIKISYIDYLDNTELVQVWIYNGSNYSDILFTDSSVSAEALFSYTPSENKTYMVRINVTHGTYSLLSQVDSVRIGPDWDIDIPTWAKKLIALFIISLIALIFTARDSPKSGGLILGLTVVFFSYIKWNVMSGISLSLIVLIIIIRRWK